MIPFIRLNLFVFFCNSVIISNDADNAVALEFCKCCTESYLIFVDLLFLNLIFILKIECLRRITRH